MKITSAAEGHCVAYRLDEGEWRVYSGPLVLQGHKIIEAKAVRCGWEESDLVTGPWFIWLEVVAGSLPGFRQFT